MNTDWITLPLCYGIGLFSAVITAVSQILLKKQANTTQKRGFIWKFLNFRVIASYALLMLTLVLNQIALIHVPVSVLPCLTATSFIWIYLLSALLLKERMGKRKIIGVAIMLLGIAVSRL